MKRAYCIAGSARRRASGFPWIGARRRRPHSDALSRLHGAPLPPTSGARSPVRLELQLDQGVTAKPPSLAAGAAAWSASPQAAGLASSPSAGTHCAGCMQNGWSTTSRVHRSRRRGELRARFDRIFRRRTGFITLDRLLQRLHGNKPEFPMVLDRPEIPPHTNGSKRDIVFMPPGERSVAARAASMAATPSSDDAHRHQTRRHFLGLSRRSSPHTCPAAHTIPAGPHPLSWTTCIRAATGSAPVTKSTKEAGPGLQPA